MAKREQLERLQRRAARLSGVPPERGLAEFRSERQLAARSHTLITLRDRRKRLLLHTLVAVGASLVVAALLFRFWPSPSSPPAVPVKVDAADRSPVMTASATAQSSDPSETGQALGAPANQAVAREVVTTPHDTSAPDEGGEGNVPPFLPAARQDGAAPSASLAAEDANSARLTIPANIAVPLILDAAIRVQDRPGAVVRARVRRDVRAGTRLIIPQGSVMTGRVVEVEKSRSRWVSAVRFWEAGRPRRVTIRFSAIHLAGRAAPAYRIQTNASEARTKGLSRAAAVPTVLATVGGAIVAGPAGAAGGGVAAGALTRSVDHRRWVPRGTRLSTRILRATPIS